MNSIVDISIVVINYKTSSLTLRCLESVFSSEITASYEVLVVDNNSNDDSKKIITEKFRNVVWIQNDYNAGFGRANNLGISIAKGKHILLLNSDLIVNKDTIQSCYTHILKDKKIGILSSVILNPDGSIQNYTSTIASYRKILERNILVDYLKKTKYQYKLEAVMGSFMMFEKETFIEVGMFDPEFFMYSEEIDLCDRYAKKGYKIEVLETAYVYHDNGGSTSDRTWANRQSYLSSALLFLKVRGYIGFILFHLLLIFNYITNFFLMWFIDKQYRKDYWNDLNNYLSNFLTYFKIPFLYTTNIGSGKRMLKLKKN